MPTDIKVVPFKTPDMRDDPKTFLRSLADDIEDGMTPNYVRAVLVVETERGYNLWSFGARTKSKMETLGLLQLGVGIQYEALTQGE